jgi:hypothetical protein
MKTWKFRLIAAVLVAALSAAALPSPTMAGVITTEAAIAGNARDRVALALSRAEVRARLEAFGVKPADVQARVDSLSDAEVAQLAARIDALPAGGDGFIGALVFVFLVLLITDIVGLTKVFPFTRSIRK